MRVHKPKVEYKLALQEKPQGSIFTYYDKTNNLTRINWLNTRLIIASNKISHEIPFKTKRVNTQRFERNLLKQSKKANHPFCYTAHNVLPTPLPFQFLFTSSIFFFFPSPQFYYFPSSMFLFPPPQLFIIFPPQYFYSPPPPPPPHLFYIFFHPEIPRPPSDSTSTHMDPTSTPHRPYIDPSSTPHRPHIDPTLNFFSF